MRKTVAVDASFLRAMLDRHARPEPVAALIRTLSAENARVVIPTPALAEVLTQAAEAAETWMQQINRYSCFQVRPFDDKASIELTRTLGETAYGIRDVLRFDRQIVAIAKVSGASVLYADDEKVVEFAAECGIPTKRLKDLG